MNLKGIIQRELAEGATKNELASAIGVSQKTLEDILADIFPEDSARWDKFARYFRRDVNFLRTGGSTDSVTIINLSGPTRKSNAGRIRRIPVLNWSQLGQLVRSKHPVAVIRADATVETTNVSGKRTVAVKVKDDSMEPMFSEGEIVFVNPDSKWKPGDYVLVNLPGRRPRTIMLRQVKPIGRQYMLHPLNRKYEDLPFRKQDKVWGKVVRSRKNF